MAVGAGAAAMMPEPAQAEERKTLEERLIDLKNQVVDVKGRFERLKSITSPQLRKNVAEKSGPEFKRRIKNLKEVAMAGTAEAALMRIGDEEMNEFSNQYGILEEIEKELDTLTREE